MQVTGHLALYCRLSKVRDGSWEGVDRQEGWGRAYATRTPPLAALPIEVYRDNDITAARDDVHRPDYERLRADVRAGRVAAVWAVEQTRLQRIETHWFTLAAELDAASIDVVHTDRDGIIRVMDEVAGIKAVLGAAEVRKLRRRINDTLGDLADEGRPNGGASWGYEHVVRDGRKALEIIPAQAETARWAARCVLAGWSLAAIVRQLEADGVPTRRGGRWAPTTVRAMLTSPTIAGQRVHRGQIVRRGDWEPILDEATWRQVCAVLTGPRTVDRDGEAWVVHGKRRAGRRYLLTGGTAVCGRCGAALVAQRRGGRDARSRKQPIYTCHRARNPDACGGLGIVAEPLEDLVRDRLLARLEHPDFLAALAADDHDQRRDEIHAALVDLDEQDVVLMRRWRAKQLSERAWDAAQADITDERRRLSGELTAIPAATVDIDPASIRQDWEWMTLDERRQQVGWWIASVTVAPARPGVRHFDAGRITIRGVDGETWGAI